MSEQPPVATFNPALLTDLDRMRDALGDTDVTAPMFPDVTYDARLVEMGQAWRLAAAAMARSLASQANAKVQSFSEGDGVSVSWGDRARRWLDIAAALEAAHWALHAPATSAGTVEVAMPTRGEVDTAEYSNGLKGWR